MYTLEEQTAGLTLITLPQEMSDGDTASDHSDWVAQYLDWYQVADPQLSLDPFPALPRYFAGRQPKAAQA